MGPIGFQFVVFLCFSSLVIFFFFEVTSMTKKRITQWFTGFTGPTADVKHW